MNKNWKLAFFLMGVMVLFAQCNSRKDKLSNEKKVVSTDQEKLFAHGFSIINQSCITCHNADQTLENRIAPPMAAVKQHYMQKGISEEKFVEDMVGFLMQPSQDLTKMPMAVKKFGLMPRMEYTKGDLTDVASYIFNHDIEAPEWFEEHFKEEQAKYISPPGENEKPFLQKGKELAMTTKAVLGKNLLNAIQTQGTSGAIEFCNVRAIPLVDSMQVALKAQIKRVSDQARNPKNKANLEEIQYIIHAKKELAETGNITPKILERGDKMVGYYPITTTAMCIQCHGIPERDITSESLQRIKSLYPEDKATGYSENQLRGIWVVEMAKN